MQRVAIALAAISIFVVGSTSANAQEAGATSSSPPFMEALRLSVAGREASETIEGERDEIETDRDSFTPAVTTAGKGRLIFESAWSFIDNRGVKETNSFPEAIFRYGLTERLEVRLGWNYEVGGAPGEISSSGIGGDDSPLSQQNTLDRDSTLSYGLKYRINYQEGFLPGSSAILQGLTPTTGQANDSQIVATYVFGWDLPNRMKLDAAIRYGTGSEGTDHFNQWAPSVVLKSPLGQRVMAHAEYFGIFSSGKVEQINSQYFSPGLHYLVTDDLEIGFRVGFGLNEQTPRFFSNIGFGWRY